MTLDDVTAEVRLVDFGSLKALVKIRIGAIEIKGFKIFEDSEGLRAEWPNYSAMFQGEERTVKIIRCTNSEAKRVFEEWLLREYESALRLEETVGTVIGE